jgi:glycerol-3-phosphate acyltransferase PlsY
MIDDALSVSPILYLLIPVAFLLGSIPFGIIVTRSKGVDLRSAGSRNIGATNVLRSAGKIPAILTLIGDIIKGALPVIICKYIINDAVSTMETGEPSSIVNDLWPGIIGLSAVLGHMFSVFLSFKGGKGVATGFGVVSVYSPAAAGIMLLIWISVACMFKYSSLAAISAVTAMPVIFILIGASNIKVIIGIILAALILYKHKSNIKNLIAGTESNIGRKS